ncbi:hypothetical protein FRB98_007087 [Tulasnella sp. 332]|nr:hypothetical protein FRB98_007087 [Tulasnella sp. 332]
MFSQTILATVAALLVATHVLSSPTPLTDTSASKRTGPTFTGKATYYFQSGVAGACGQVNPDTALIGAMNAAQYPGTCGESVVVTNTQNGKFVTIRIEDLCPGCAANSLDLSVAGFGAIGAEADGVLPIVWHTV